MRGAINRFHELEDLFSQSFSHFSMNVSLELSWLI